MSLGALFVPFTVALVLALVAGVAARVHFPPTAARFGVALTVAVVVAYVPSVLLLSLGYVAHLPILGSGVRWCAQAVGLHAAVPAWVGLPSLGLAVAGGWGAVRIVRQWRRLRLPGSGRFEVVDRAEPFAVTLPGRHGAVVLSRGLVDLLDAREQSVVLAHEESHVAHRHDRFLLVCELGAAVVPPLRLLARRVRLAVERWADEDAAVAVGDRAFVAATLGKVALCGTARPGLAPAFGAGQVIPRVTALLAAAPLPPRRHALAWIWVSGVVAASLAVLQVHHLEQLVTALCPH